MFSMFLNPNDGGYRYLIVTMAQPDFCGKKGVYQDWNKAYSSNINLNAWNDVVVHVKFNYDSPGITKVWVNGTLVMNSTKPNAYNDYIGPYLKIGTYVASKDMAAPNTVYFDEIRVGDAKSSYYEVAPNNGIPVLTNNLVAPKLKIELTN